MTRIRTRYGANGKGAGRIVATGAGRQATLPYPHQLNPDGAHRAAATMLADKLGEPLALTVAGEGNGWREFDTIVRWPADEARQIRAMAVDSLTNHGHAGYWDELTRSACGACALDGYGAFAEDGRPYMPNYGAWARIYIQAGRPIPPEYRDAFRLELAGSDPDDPNLRYADALRRDIVTFGGWDL